MRKQIPLNALRAFESAGRHLSFSKAAAELYVTPGAVSQQIKTLEDYLDLKLFQRMNRAIVPTAAARACLPELTAALDKIETAMGLLQQQESNRPLTVTLSPAFGSRWLVPRLQKFQSQHPDIDVRLDATTNLVDLHKQDIDIAIRFGAGQYPGLLSHCILNQQVFPVCSPSIIDPRRPLNIPEDLRHYILLHGDYPFGEYAWPDWTTWFKTAGVENMDTHQGLRFTDPDMIIQAAIAAQGVALAGSVAVAAELSSGRLIKPFKQSISPGYSYYIVHTADKARNPKVQAFKQWLIAESSR